MVVIRGCTCDGAATEDLQRIGHLHRRHRRDDRVQHPGRLAGGLRPRRRVGIDAAQARRAARDHGHGEAVTAHRGAVDPRDPAAHREIVHQVARLEIIRAVQDGVGAAEKFFRVGGRQIGHHAARLHGGIDARDAPRRRRGFGKRLGGVALFEQPLAMQVARAST